MNPVQIGRVRFSEIFWNIIDEKTVDAPWGKINEIVDQQQKLREDADYNTGSLDEEDAAELFKLVSFFRPKVIAEVGTFIGVSTRAMREASSSTEIHTCDVSNGIQVSPSDTKIFQYPKTSSTEMFKQLAEKKIGVDMIYVDGRLSQEDFEHFPKIVHDQTIFVFDDFEGIEKGVVNAMMLESSKRVLIYPRDGKKTAVSLPFTMLQFVPQESV